MILLHPIAYAGPDQWTAWVANVILYHPLEFVSARESLKLRKEGGWSYTDLSERDRSALAHTIEDRIKATAKLPTVAKTVRRKKR